MSRRDGSRGLPLPVLIIGIVAAMVAVGVAYDHFQLKPRRRYNDLPSHMLTWRVERSAVRQDALPLDSIIGYFSELEDGVGARTILVRNTGDEVDSMEVRLDSLGSYKSVGGAQRRPAIEGYRDELLRAERDFLAKGEYYLPLTVFTDVTEGGNDAIVRRVEKIFGELDLSRLLDERKIGLEVTLRRLSEGDYSDGSDFEIRAGTGAAPALRELSDSLHSLVRGQQPRQESCIFYGLWNALREQDDMSGRVVVVHSDGVENCERTFSLYSGWRDKLERKNWGQLDKVLINSEVEMPNLTGVRFYWIVPPATGDDASRVHAIERYLRHLLEDKAKATLVTRFTA